MKTTIIGDHAVVLGASMAGLLTARVLADAYARVTVVERDNLPPDVGHRRGVPQGRHVHVLHARGRELLDELFPGFTEQVVQAGAAIGTAWASFDGSCRVISYARLISGCPGWVPVGHCWRATSDSE
jgi:2-polyprenyl-6-methoxyphenol hydroxylase-like FAD-dependent oxidoreductase